MAGSGRITQSRFVVCSQIGALSKAWLNSTMAL